MSASPESPAAPADPVAPDAVWSGFHPAVAEWFRRRFPDGATTPIVSLRTAEWKLIHAPALGRYELYDLRHTGSGFTSPKSFPTTRLSEANWMPTMCRESIH